VLNAAYEHAVTASTANAPPRKVQRMV
jgi:hypothetical protein